MTCYYCLCLTIQHAPPLSLPIQLGQWEGIVLFCIHLIGLKCFRQAQRSANYVVCLLGRASSTSGCGFGSTCWGSTWIPSGSGNLRIEDWGFRIEEYGLIIEDWTLRIEDRPTWGFRVEDYGLIIEDWELRIEGWGLRIADWGIRIEDCGLSIEDSGLRIEHWWSRI